MKNIHILPTEKPSKLYKHYDLLVLDEIVDTTYVEETQNQHIYITSDEEIKEGDWCYHPLLKGSIIQSKFDEPNSTMKKIILTTDVDLINNGVQAIDDEFLEWFVKNTSCESVEVSKFCRNGDDCPSLDIYNKQGLCNIGYKIIIIPKEDLSYTTKMGVEVSDEIVRATMIPKEYFGKEEPKQETLEEVAEKFQNNFKTSEPNAYGLAFKLGAKWEQERSYSEVFENGKNWQSERSYSEEDMKQFGLYLGSNLKELKNKTIDEIFEQFKKK